MITRLYRDLQIWWHLRMFIFYMYVHCILDDRKCWPLVSMWFYAQAAYESLDLLQLDNLTALLEWKETI